MNLILIWQVVNICYFATHSLNKEFSQIINVTDLVGFEATSLCVSGHIWLMYLSLPLYYMNPLTTVASDLPPNSPRQWGIHLNSAHTGAKAEQSDSIHPSYWRYVDPALF